MACLDIFTTFSILPIFWQALACCDSASWACKRSGAIDLLGDQFTQSREGTRHNQEGHPLEIFAGILTMEHSDESTSSIATSAITTPSSLDPCILINIVPDLLESTFLRVPSQQYPQIWRTCRALKGSLDESMFLGRYIEEQVVESGEIMVLVKLGWRIHVAHYRNICSGRVSWELG